MLKTAADLMCLDCGYDLRAHGNDDACPECGLAVVESQKVRQAFPDSRRLRRVILGMYLFVAAGTLGFLHWHHHQIWGVCGQAFLEATLYKMYHQHRWLFHTIEHTSVLMGALGIWLMTTPAGPAHHHQRFVGRWWVLFSFAMLWLMPNYGYVVLYDYEIESPMERGLLALIRAALLVMLILGTVCLLKLAGHGADQLGRSWLRRFITIISVDFVISYASRIPVFALAGARGLGLDIDLSAPAWRLGVGLCLDQIHVFGVLVTSPLIGIALLVLAHHLRRITGPRRSTNKSFDLRTTQVQ